LLVGGGCGGGGGCGDRVAWGISGYFRMSLQSSFHVHKQRSLKGGLKVEGWVEVSYSVCVAAE
jgi:hypothetical protein